MKKFLTMTFVFTLASTTGVLGANNTQTCNNTINDCKIVKIVECENSNKLNKPDCNLNNNYVNNNNCVKPEVPTSDENVEVPTLDENVETPTLDENVEVPTLDENVETPTLDESVEVPTSDENVDTITEDTDTGLDSILEIEKEVVELVNQERAKYGLSPLEIDTEVSYVARLKSQNMADLNYFSHTSPTYGSPFDMLAQFNISYKSAGENIAMGQKTAAEVVNAWMNSEGHRANILNSSYTHIGVGYVLSGNTPYWTQMFISK